MTWRRAPLYVRAHALALWLARHAEGVTAVEARTVASETAALGRDLLGRDLLGALSVALTFPSERRASQRAADRTLVELRVRVRLLVDLGGATARQARHAVDAIDEVGRMLGGWQLQAARRRRNASPAAGPSDAT